MATKAYSARPGRTKPPAGSVTVAVTEEAMQQQAQARKEQARGRRIRRRMPMQEQLESQEGVRGKREFYVDGEQSVEWFLAKYVNQPQQTPGYAKWREQKQALQAAGDMPRSYEEHLEHVRLSEETGQLRESQKEQLASFDRQELERHGLGSVEELIVLWSEDEAEAADEEAPRKPSNLIPSLRPTNEELKK